MLQDEERMTELTQEVENLIAFLLIIEDMPGAFQWLEERGFTEDDYRHLKFHSYKLLAAFMPKRLAS